MRAAINVILSIWTNGTPLHKLLPHFPKLYSQLRERKSLCRLINQYSGRMLHSRNRLNLMVWDMHLQGRLIRDPAREKEMHKKLESRNQATIGK